jgi:hypothetical protein
MWVFLLLLGLYLLYAYKKYSHLLTFYIPVSSNAEFKPIANNNSIKSLYEKAQQYQKAQLNTDAASYYRLLLAKTKHADIAYQFCKLLAKDACWPEIHAVSQLYQYDPRLLHMYFHSVIALKKYDMPGIDSEYVFHPMHPAFDFDQIDLSLKKWTVTVLSKIHLKFYDIYQLVCQYPSRLRMQIFTSQILNDPKHAFDVIIQNPLPEWLIIESVTDLYQFAMINHIILKDSMTLICAECHYKLVNYQLICPGCGAFEMLNEILHIEKLSLGELL